MVHSFASNRPQELHWLNVFNDEEQQLVCFNWRNLRPMWAAENISKSDDYDPADEVDWAYMTRELGYDGELFLLFEEGRGGL